MAGKNNRLGSGEISNMFDIFTQPQPTQLVCLRLEKWLNRFLVPDQLGTVWGLLGRPEADL